MAKIDTIDIATSSKIADIKVFIDSAFAALDNPKKYVKSAKVNGDINVREEDFDVMRELGALNAS